MPTHRLGKLQFVVVLSLFLIASFAGAVMKGVVQENWAPPALTDAAILLLLLVVRGRSFQLIAAGYFLITVVGGVLLLGWIMTHGSGNAAAEKLGLGLYGFLQIVTVGEVCLNIACVWLLIRSRSAMVQWLNAVHAAIRWL